MSKGYVYVLSNPAFAGLVKIGMTTGDPVLRAAQLSTTGVPEDFVLETSFKSPDCVELEKRAHILLADQRVRSGREFFRLSVNEACDQIATLHAEQISEWIDDFGHGYTLVESPAFVDPSSVYFISDACEESVQDICLAIGDLRPCEIAPSLGRLRARREKILHFKGQ